MSRRCSRCGRPLRLGDVVGALGNRIPSDEIDFDKRHDVIRCSCGAWYRLTRPWLASMSALAASLGGMWLALIAPWPAALMAALDARPYALATALFALLCVVVGVVLCAFARWWPLRRGRSS